jgi:hypothetical protein
VRMQDAASELSALIDRARHLMGMLDMPGCTAQSEGAMTAPLRQFTPCSSTPGLDPVDEFEVRMGARACRTCMHGCVTAALGAGGGGGGADAG